MKVRGGPSRMIALACVAMMLAVPATVAANSISGKVASNEIVGKSNTLGEASLELYNYASIDTDGTANIVENTGALLETERWVKLPGKSTDTPVGATGPWTLYNTNDSVPGLAPDGKITSVVSQVRNGNVLRDKTWTGGTDPTGQEANGGLKAFDQGLNIIIGGNNNDSLPLVAQPSGTPAVATRSNDSLPTSDLPSGTVDITALTDDASMTAIQPTGAQVINPFRHNATPSFTQAPGIVDNLVRNFSGAMTNIAPTGNSTINFQAMNLTGVVVAPAGVPASISGTYYIGNLTVDGNETGVADSLVNVVLIDTIASGVYDSMAVSINDIVFNEGVLNDGICNYGPPPGGNNNDELMNAPGNVVLGNSPLFFLDFDGDPTADADDARIRTQEWYTGNLVVDADSDGVVDDTVYYSIFDENSDGVFDSIDLSLGDTTFGQGDIEDGQVLTGNDEVLLKLIGGVDTLGPDDFGYTWYDKAEYDWIEVNGTGTDASLTDDSHLTVDLGFDFVYYGDTFNNTTICSNGFITFNETDDWDLDSTWWGWENVPDSRDGVEGPLCPLCDDNDPGVGGAVYYHTYGTAPNRYFVVEFDDVTDWNTNSNDRTAEIIIYERTNLIKMQWQDIGSGLNIIGIEHNNESTGIGTGGSGETWINITNITNGTAYMFYPPGSVGSGSVQIGDYVFKFGVAPVPALAMTDINMTSAEWFAGLLKFDASENGQAEDELFYMIADTDSNGIYDQLDLSLNGTFGVGNLGNSILNDTNGERYTFGAMPTTLTIGPTLPFGIDFDRFPEADNDDLRLTATRWYEGSFMVDADDDGLADEVIYYVLTDSNSDGTYNTVDLSFGDATFGQGALTEGNVSGAGDDERFQWSSRVFLGPSIQFTLTSSGTPTGGTKDMIVENLYTFQGNLTFDSDSDGQTDDDLFFVISDMDSDGIYDTLDLSFDPLFGEGTLNDGLMTLSPYNDERLSGDGDVQLGTDMNYNISFDTDPQNDNEDLRLRVKVWFKGAFLVDADNDGVASESVHYVLTDTDSNGFFDTMDLSLGNEVFGEGNLNDGDLVPSNDERITAVKDITVGSALKFQTSFSGSPGGAKKDGTLKNLDLYAGSFTVDLGINGVADDIVNFAVSDSDSDGLYDTMDLSLGNEVFREDLSSDGYVDQSNNDESMTASGEVRIGAFYYDLSFVPNPHVATVDAVLTSDQWFLGGFALDADGDGLVNETVSFLISDLDSDGVFDNMDLSLGDQSFDEGDGGDDVLGDDNDEAITAQSDIVLDDLLLNLRFTPSPNQNIEDAWLKDIRWYTGSIVTDGWTVGYAICDVNSDGIFDTVEMTDDAEFGEGDGYDDYLKLNNDEVSKDGDMLIKGAWHYEVFVNGSMAGPQDVGLKSLEWRTGRWLVEGETRSVAVSDSDSDGVMDSIHIDMDDDGSFSSPGDIMGGISGFRGSLTLTYVVSSSNADGTEIEITPMGGSTGSTDSWMVGTLRAQDITVALALSDANDDNMFDTLDMDATGDGVIDTAGMTETNEVYGTIGTVDHQMLAIAPSGESVSIIGYTGAIVSSSIDRSVFNVIKYGSVTEADVGADLNIDGDLGDTLNVVAVDVSTTGHISSKVAIYADLDLEGDLTNDEPLGFGMTFEMGDSVWKVDDVTFNRDHVGLMKVTRPSATHKTGPDGAFLLQPSVLGTFWIKVSSPHAEWGYSVLEDTNSHEGYKVSSAGITNKDQRLLESGAYIEGRVTDMITGDALSGVTVTVNNLGGDAVVSTLTLNDGTYRLGLGFNRVVDVSFSKKGYVTDDGTRSNGTWHGMAVGGGRKAVDVSLMPDPAPEILSFVEPASGEVLTGQVTVTVEVTDLVVVNGVKLTVNSGISWFDMNEVGGNVFSAQWDTGSNPDGTYRITARATNDVGLRADSHLDVIVDNGGPVVVFKTAAEQYGNVEFKVVAQDDFSDVDKVEISINGGPWQRMSKEGKEHYFVWGSGPFDSGTVKYKVRATDSRGNMEVYESSVSVDNTWMLLLIVTIIVGIVAGIVIMKKRGAGKKEEDIGQTAPPPAGADTMPPPGPAPGPEAVPEEGPEAEMEDPGPAMPEDDMPREVEQ